MKHGTLVIAILFHLNIYVVTNESYKTKNYVFHWCVFSSVNRWEKVCNRAINRVC